MTLTANANLDHAVDQEFRSMPAGAGAHLFRDGAVGIDPAGMCKPFVPGDVFVGFAADECDNSSGAAAAKFVRLYTLGDFVLPLAGAADKHVGRAIYATSDNTFALTGHPDAFVGRILHKDVDASGFVMVRLKEPGEKPINYADGSIEFLLRGQTIAPTGAAGADADVHTGGVILNSALGLGVKNVSQAGGGYDLEFDAVAEIAQASVRTPQVFVVSKGVTFEGRLHLTDIGDNAALDVDFGLVDAVTANTRLNMDHADGVSLALFHMDGASANILAQSDNNVTDVAPVDTTADNVATAGGHKDFKIIGRPDGTCEFWIDGARVLSSTLFAMATTAVVAAVINAEKTSDDTTCVVRIDKLRAAGAAAA